MLEITKLRGRLVLFKKSVKVVENKDQGTVKYWKRLGDMVKCNIISIIKKNTNGKMGEV